MGMGLFAGLCLVASTAAAQPEDALDEAASAEDESAAEEADATDGEEDGDAADQDGDDGDAAEQDGDDGDAKDDGEDGDDALDPKELESEAYYFVGLRFRDFIVPQFMIEIFADGGATVNAFTFGGEFTYRKNGLEMIPAISYADYSMDPFLFKGKDEDKFAYERVSSDMKLLYVTLDIMFEAWVEEKSRFALLVGGGVGLGGVFGNLYRNQIYPENANNEDFEDESKWQDCEGVGQPPGTGEIGRASCRERG